jgi:hypothetical protein
MDLTAREIERIPRGNLRVPLVAFAGVWLAAERRGEELAMTGDGDSYLTRVLATCRWLACMPVVTHYPHGPVRHLPSAPITGTQDPAHEELIADELVAA